MGSFLSFLAAQQNGILLLLLLLIVLGALVNWLLWMFGWGRFKPTQIDSKIRYVLTDFFVKIISDFRHLLALVIVLLFATALFAAMWPGMMKQDVTILKDGLQGVAAALGGLIGSIIGYYFGESAASKSRLPVADQPPPPSIPVEQQESPDKGEGIETPPKPASLQEGAKVE